MTSSTNCARPGAATARGPAAGQPAQPVVAPGVGLLVPRSVRRRRPRAGRGPPYGWPTAGRPRRRPRRRRAPSLRPGGRAGRVRSVGGALIALPRCARSALRAGAVSMIRSQARSSPPSAGRCARPSCDRPCRSPSRIRSAARSRTDAARGLSAISSSVACSAPRTNSRSSGPWPGSSTGRSSGGVDVARSGELALDDAVLQRVVGQHDDPAAHASASSAAGMRPPARRARRSPRSAAPGRSAWPDAPRCAATPRTAA